jgi:hypothetical protein
VKPYSAVRALLLPIAALAFACEGNPTFNPTPIGPIRHVLDATSGDGAPSSNDGSTTGGDASNTNNDSGVVSPDGGQNDGGNDGGGADGGGVDGGTSDTGGRDGGSIDSGASDTGATDTGRIDTGVSDTGTTDTGVTPDAGGGCTTNAQCASPTTECVSPTPDANGSLQPCNGTCTGGLCREPCDPFTTATVCGAGQSCVFAGPTSQIPSAGLCVTAGTGGTQGQACTATFDTNGNITSDTCDTTRNYQCFGAIPGTPNGTCARLCSASEPALCPSLGSEYTCAGTSIGVCLLPPPSITDIGEPCPASPATCQGGLCDSAIGPGCSFSCAGLNQCPSNAVCVVESGTNAAICAFACTPGTNPNASCMARNGAAPNCTDVGGGVGVCTP